MKPIKTLIILLILNFIFICLNSSCGNSTSYSIKTPLVVSGKSIDEKGECSIIFSAVSLYQSPRSSEISRSYIKTSFSEDNCKFDVGYIVGRDLNK